MRFSTHDRTGATDDRASMMASAMLAQYLLIAYLMGELTETEIASNAAEADEMQTALATSVAVGKLLAGRLASDGHAAAVNAVLNGFPRVRERGSR